MNKLKIEKLIFGGLGLARIDGKAIFIEGGVPGDEVFVELVGKKGGVDLYRIKEIIDSSQHRREPSCKYYGTCGGCDWLHIKYDYQLKSKRDIFLEQLKRVGKINDLPEVNQIYSNEFAYRIRAQLKIDKESNAMGFFRKGSNEIIDIESCPLLCDSLNHLLKNRKKIIPNLDENVKQVKLISSNNEIVSFPVLESFTKEKSVFVINNKKILVSGKNFFQSNKFLLSDMANWVAEKAKGETFIDMYGGLGFFSLFLGQKFKEGLLIESDTKMARAAQKNFKRNNLNNIKALALSSEKFFSSREARTADCIIVDPPRPGLTKKVRLALGELLPKQIIYISCNPATQARDVGFLINHRGYNIKDAALFDLYPNTHHMESGLVLER